MRNTIITIIILILGLAFGVQDDKNVIGEDYSLAKEPIMTDFTITKNMNFQGTLYLDGNPVNDTMDIWFGIYANPTGGNTLFEQTKTDVEVISGFFSVTLTDVPNSVFPANGPTRYLEIKAPSTGPALTPRLELASVGYSYHSITADTAGYAIIGSITRPITPPVYSDEIRDTTIIETKIKDGAITMPKLNQSGANNGQVIKWIGTAWAPGNDSVGSGGTGDNAWVRGTPDSVLYTIRNLGISRGGANNMLYGSNRINHVNLGTACTTGTSGQNYGYCTVSGGNRNTASYLLATVGGGLDNTASGPYTTVPGGAADTASGYAAMVGGGILNSASGYCAMVGGGLYNMANNSNATVPGGYGDTASGMYATVGGGHTNTASGDRSTVSGGYSNTASATYATVGGGFGDTASNMYATVGGGHTNTASGDRSTVSGGYSNTASGYHATVGGGYSDTASGNYATVSGGNHNIAYWNAATIGGGEDNRATELATVGGGYNNSGVGYASVIGGGRNNYNGGQYTTIPGGYADSIAVGSVYSFAAGCSVAIGPAADYAFAFGRNFSTSTPNAVVFHNTVNPIKVGIGTSAPDTTLHIVGNLKMVDGNQAAGRVLVSDANGLGTWQTPPSGSDNDWVRGTPDSVLYTIRNLGISRGGAGNMSYGNSRYTHVNLGAVCTTGTSGLNDSFCTVIGGRSNKATRRFTTVCGGLENTASRGFSIVGGGFRNTACTSYATVGGGWYNMASGYGSTVSGGEGNTTSTYCSTIGGGYYNHAKGGGFNTVGGGSDNTASNGNATVSGGEWNTASGLSATVPGGFADTAAGAYSLAAGSQVKIAPGANYTFAFGRNFSTSTPNAVVFHNTVNPIKVGIGTSAPDTTLHIVGNLKMVDGNQAAGRVLVSDANGLGTWQTPPSVSDNDWIRGTPDSVLYTIRNLGISRGGANNMLYGNYRNTHVNFGVNCTTGTSGQNYNYCTVSGGLRNIASGSGATVCGGGLNTASGNNAIVGGGWNNDASGNEATVGGGYYDLSAGYAATVGGGYFNEAQDSFSTIGGGKNNLAVSQYGTVGGGYQNWASGYYSTTGGGRNNSSGPYATVAGGSNNDAQGYYATVGGGSFNTTSGLWGMTIGGGSSNRASGNYSTVPGGRNDSAGGDYSFAAGRRAKSRNKGCFTWGDSTDADVINNTDNCWVARASGGVYFYTNSSLSSGSYLAAGGTGWNPISDSAIKENFRSVDKRALLEKLSQMRLREWNLKSQDPSIRHIGPVAQDFYNAFGYGESNKSINLQDCDGIAFAAIQALYEELKLKSTEIEALKAEIEKLKK